MRGPEPSALDEGLVEGACHGGDPRCGQRSWVSPILPPGVARPSIQAPLALARGLTSLLPAVASACRSLPLRPPTLGDPDLPEAACRHGESQEDRWLPGSQYGRGDWNRTSTPLARCEPHMAWRPFRILAPGWRARNRGASSGGACVGSPCGPASLRSRGLPPQPGRFRHTRNARGSERDVGGGGFATTSNSSSKGGFAPLTKWSGRLESNQRPPEPHSGALPNLRHAPTLESGWA